jgi:hypothetical protein
MLLCFWRGCGTGRYDLGCWWVVGGVDVVDGGYVHFNTDVLR